MRPLNPEAPYYEWEISEPGSGVAGALIIYSECCADRFSQGEEIELLKSLAVRHGYTLSRLRGEAE